MIVLGLSRSTIFELERLKNENGDLILDNDNLSETEALQWLNYNIQKIENNSSIPKLLIDEIHEVLNAYVL